MPTVWEIPVPSSDSLGAQPWLQGEGNDGGGSRDEAIDLCDLREKRLEEFHLHRRLETDRAKSEPHRRRHKDDPQLITQTMTLGYSL